MECLKRLYVKKKSCRFTCMFYGTLAVNNVKPKPNDKVLLEAPVRNVRLFQRFSNSFIESFVAQAKGTIRDKRYRGGCGAAVTRPGGPLRGRGRMEGPPSETPKTQGGPQAPVNGLPPEPSEREAKPHGCHPSTGCALTPWLLPARGVQALSSSFWPSEG